MCGIAGLWNAAQGPEDLSATAMRMTQVLRHRGPDAQNVAQGPQWALGSARLAIMDPAKGHQPMWNEDHTIALVGNNEIYNAPQLREALEARGHHFVSHSDTEVALHGWEEWGEDCFGKLSGMFALALVDTRRRVCVLARDGMGIKPLHVARVGPAWAFASEIKAFFEIKEFRTAPNRDAIHLFMNFRYVPDERTLFEGVERLEPGSLRVLGGDLDRKKKFFSWDAAALTPTPKNYADATAELQSHLKTGVERHLQSDVEVAAYLSGGIDSSTVTVLAARKATSMRSFCLAFGEPTDEHRDAARLAQFAGTNHQTLETGASPLDRFAEIIWHVEEPKVNCVQGFVLAEAAAAHVKVALSGLGGDELFAGYVNNDILFPMTLLRRWHHPERIRSLSGLQRRRRDPRLDYYFRAGELALNLTHPVAYYSILRNSFDHNTFLLNSLYAAPPPHWKDMSFETLRAQYDGREKDSLNAILRLEARTKLINDFLLTEDRVSMAHSLEVRVPFLDKDLMSYAFALPSSMKYQPGNRKRILKDAAAPWLPDWVFHKKKWGFSFNPYLLFQGPLRAMASEVLTKDRVEALGLFSWPWIQDVLRRPPSPRMRWHYFNLWVMAGFVLWHDRFFDGSRHGR